MAKSARKSSAGGLVRLDTPDAIIVSSMGIKTPRHRRKSSKKLDFEVPEIPEKSVHTEKPKVYLYIQLANITNLPRTNNEVELVVQLNKNKLERVEEHYTGDSEFYLKDFKNHQPVYSLPINQDSLEDMNTFSDNPLLVTLFEHVVEPLENDSLMESRDGSIISRNVNGEEVKYFQRVVPIAQGVVDILSMFSQKRSSRMVETFLYPLDQMSTALDWGTCKTEWHLYTLMPLMKEINFVNMVFITFESIYNAPGDIMNLTGDLIAELSFRLRQPDEHGKYHYSTICTFGHFSRDIIVDQDANIRWEGAKSHDQYGRESLSLHTGTKIHIHKLFKRLLCSEGVDFKFKDIDMYSEEAIICNAMHRYIINSQMKEKLENLGLKHEHELVIRIYRQSARDEILLEGSFSGQVFLYPSVNAVRFAVALSRSNDDSLSLASERRARKKMDKTARRSVLRHKSVIIEDPLAGGDSTSTFNTIASDRTIFAILNICLMDPITEPPPNALTYYSENQIKRDPLKSCKRTRSENFYMSTTEDAYQEFDDLMQVIIDHIVRNSLKTIGESKEYFCCQLNNVNNKILKLIAVDFNQRFPTKTNIEFTRLMTTVYKELVERCYDLVNKCSVPDIRNCLLEQSTGESFQSSRFLNIAKYMYEIEDNAMGDFFMKKIDSISRRNPELPFYLCLYDIEKRNYENASKRVVKFKEERAYCSHLISIYIDYMEGRDEEDEALQAAAKTADLFANLRELSTNYPHRSESFILLHCLYKEHAYVPGVEYTRWRFEDLYDLPQKELYDIPTKSLWRIYFEHNINFNAKKAQVFYKTVQLFLDLGAYSFAEIIFRNIAKECSAPEAYMFTTTLKILMDKVDPEQKPENFPTLSEMENPVRMKAFQNQVNGNLEFSRGNLDAAMEYYGQIVQNEELYDFHSFEISLMRYAQYKTKLGEPEDLEAALKAFELCCVFNDNCLLAKFETGRTLYKLGRLEEACSHLADATEFGIHIPDMWAYLALINLKLGHNFNAIECWKQAKLNPENVISEEIYLELSKIDVNTINLYVDKPAYF